MAKRYILKTDVPSGVPHSFEISDFEAKHGLSVNEIRRLYVAFKVGKRRKLKRLHLKKDVRPCDMCGWHASISGSVGGVSFDHDIY